MGINVFHLFHLPHPPGQPLLDSSCWEHCVVKDSAVEKDCVESGSGFREKDCHVFTYGSWAQTGWVAATGVTLSDTRELKSRDLGYSLYILLLDELQANKVCLSPSIKWRQKSLLLSFAGTWWEYIVFTGWKILKLLEWRSSVNSRNSYNYRWAPFILASSRAGVKMALFADLFAVVHPSDLVPLLERNLLSLQEIPK